MPRKVRYPTSATVERALNTLIEGAYPLPDRLTKGSFARRQDDTDGKRGSDQFLALAFSDDGDAWVRLPGVQSLRFRSYGGGGMSQRVRNALIVVAEAIRRDNLERPQSAPEERNDAVYERGVAAADDWIMRLHTGQLSVVEEDQDGYLQGFADRIALLRSAFR